MEWQNLYVLIDNSLASYSAKMSEFKIKFLYGIIFSDRKNSNVLSMEFL